MKIEAKNLTAQLLHRARGNPPSTLANSAISNCFPGLEFDFRNIWRRLFVGIELHEADNLVVAVDPRSPYKSLLHHRLLRVAEDEQVEVAQQRDREPAARSAGSAVATCTQSTAARTFVTEAPADLPNE